MALVAAKGLAVIGRDKKIRSKPGELALLHDHGLRVFWIAGKGDSSNWDNLCLLVRRWDDVERVVAERGPGPWFMAINEGNVTSPRSDCDRRRDHSVLAVCIGRGRTGSRPGGCVGAGDGGGAGGIGRRIGSLGATVMGWPW